MNNTRGDKVRKPRHEGNELEGVPFDPDLAKVLMRRWEFKIDHFVRIVKRYNPEISVKTAHNKTRTFFHKILIPALSNEVNRYAGKNRFPYVEDIERARKGGSSSLFRLIRWDKGWLFIDWVRTRILMGQWRRDISFLKGLGEAIGREPGCEKAFTGKDSEEQKLIVELIQMLYSMYLSRSSLRKEDALNEVIKVMFFGLEKEMREWPVEVYDEHFYSDLNYFRQYIKRHIIL